MHLIKLFFALILLVLSVGTSHALTSNKISLQAEDTNSNPQNWALDFYEHLFGPGHTFTLDLYFHDFAPLTQVFGSDYAISTYDFAGIVITGSNNRPWAFTTSSPLTISTYNEPGHELHSVDVPSAQGIATTEPFPNYGIGTAMLSVQWQFLGTPINGGLPNTSLGSLSYLHNLPSYGSNFLNVVVGIPTLFDGTIVDYNAIYNMLFDNYSAISNPAPVPIGSAMPFLGVAIGTVGIVAVRLRRRRSA